MRTYATPLAGLFEIETDSIGDTRGRFTRIFCEHELAGIRPSLHFTQANISFTTQRGAVRGLHFQQSPAAEAKLIRCLRGSVFDVAVDLRRDSPTFLRWHALELSADNSREIFIPEGFAHGFQALSNEVELLYLHTAPWTPSCESGLRHDDLRLGINWPLPVTQISPRDTSFALLDENFMGVFT